MEVTTGFQKNRQVASNNKAEATVQQRPRYEGQTQQKRWNGNKGKQIDKRRFQVDIYDFYDGICEICDRSEAIFGILKDFSPSKSLPKNIEEANSVLRNLVKMNIPNIEGKKNMLWEFKITAKHVHIKTDRYIGFGWYIGTERQENGEYVTKYTFTIDVFGDRQDALINDLIEMNWNEYNPGY